jgi:hypothetical protein
VQRRAFLQAALLAVPVPVGQVWPKGQRSRTICAQAGSYTTEQCHARRVGVYARLLNPAAVSVTHRQHVGDLVNLSFPITSPYSKFLHSVHDNGGSRHVIPDRPVQRPSHTGQSGRHRRSPGAERWRTAGSPDARFVCCPNPGHDSIARFRVHPQTCLLTQSGRTPCRRKRSAVNLSRARRQLPVRCQRTERQHQLTAVWRPVRNLSPVTIAFAKFSCGCRIPHATPAIFISGS